MCLDLSYGGIPQGSFLGPISFPLNLLCINPEQIINLPVLSAGSLRPPSAPERHRGLVGSNLVFGAAGARETPHMDLGSIQAHV